MHRLNWLRGGRMNPIWRKLWIRLQKEEARKDKPKKLSLESRMTGRWSIPVASSHRFLVSGRWRSEQAEKIFEFGGITVSTLCFVKDRRDEKGRDKGKIWNKGWDKGRDEETMRVTVVSVYFSFPLLRLPSFSSTHLTWYSQIQWLK